MKNVKNDEWKIMKLIVGLGNPGKQYEGTRHNAGFYFLDQIICDDELMMDGECINFQKSDKFDSMIAETLYKGEKLILVKPQTYMNLSGQAVQKIMSFYKMDISDLIVISDDKDLPLGTARIRHEGSSGGQKGLQNIIDLLGDNSFLRIRIGINAIGGDADKPEPIMNNIDTADFVLSKFNQREKPVLKSMIEEIIKYIMPFLGSKTEIPAHTLEVKFDSQ